MDRNIRKRAKISMHGWMKLLWTENLGVRGYAVWFLCLNVSYIGRAFGD